MSEDLYSMPSRVVRLETRLFGIEGRGGIVDEIEELGDKITALDQRVSTRLNRATAAFASAALALVGAIVSHTL